MAKFYDDSVLDAALAELATSTRLVVTSAQPANFAGIAAVALADVAVTNGLGGGDWSAAANGDTSGRKTTMAQQATITVDSSGTATHVCYDDATTLQGGTTCTSQALTAGNTVTVPAHDHEWNDPT
jgi:hypothetical protein